MTEISETDRQAVKEFVQEVLGCTCPNEVFRNINLEKNPSNFADLSRGDLIAIGDKLLVYIVKASDGEVLAGMLPQLFNLGREKRDEGGFNRFRLVVSTSETQSTRETLTRRYEALEDLDERLHLHVIGVEQLLGLI